MTLSEHDTRAKLIDPGIKSSGWGEEAIRREVRITQGRPYLVGDVVRRKPGLIADYVLYWKGVPVAVVEAKDDSHHEAAGLQQAKQYASMLDVKFAFASNGKAFVEFDYLSNTETTLKMHAFPGPTTILSRLQGGAVLPTAADDPMLYPYSGYKQPRYYQDVAVRRTLADYRANKDRLLLTLATGTGKTFIAAEIAWKLYKTKHVKRVLFLADRTFLRDQAYNEFGFFKGPSGDPRYVIEGGEISGQHELYFGMYQTLYADRDGKALYRQLPPDFFDLIVVDECHRSGFGTWREILDYYKGATHLGLTATPKRTDNIDTYAYFGDPCYSYSLGQGIEDGFLATYKVHRVQTNLDEAGGINVEDAVIAGADLFVPEGADQVKDFYSVNEFERKITLPDWTEAICAHLAGLIRSSGSMDKTLVFCVNMDHALQVRQYMQNHFADLGLPDYAARIVSEEHDAAAQLADFADPTKRTPVVVTTVDLLSTGVDIPPVRNIVFIRPVGSVVVFKQIVGRGTRLDETTGKQWFRIVDYTNATRLFDEWDRPLGEGAELPPPPWQGVIKLEVLDAEKVAPVPGAWAIAVAAPNRQLQLRPEGDYLVARELPESAIEVHVGATDYRTRIVTLPAVAEAEAEVAVVELRAIAEAAEPILLKGVQVEITSEIIITVDAAGRQMTVEEYLAYSKGNVIDLVPYLGDLRQAWIADDSRGQLQHDLEGVGVLTDLIADLFKVHDADGFDVLGHLGFDAPLVRREERIEAFHNYNSNWLASHDPDRQRVILALLDSYRDGGIDQLRRQVLQLDRFKSLGGVRGVMRLLGGTGAFDVLVAQIKERLYPEDKAAAAA